MLCYEQAPIMLPATATNSKMEWVGRETSAYLSIYKWAIGQRCRQLHSAARSAVFTGTATGLPPDKSMAGHDAHRTVSTYLCSCSTRHQSARHALL